MQAEQRAYLEIQRAERIAALERRIFEHAFTLFERAETGALAASAKRASVARTCTSNAKTARRC